MVRPMKNITFAAALALSIPCFGQTLLYDNGTFVTHPGAGPDGSDLSVTQNGIVISLGNDRTTTSGTLKLADNFVATDNWRLTQLYWYEVQSQPAADRHTDFRIPEAYVELYDGDPRLGGQVIAGDMMTNRLIGGVWSGAWRLSSSGNFDNSRPIFQCTIDLSDFPVLPPGEYWIAVSVEGEPGVTSAIGSVPIPQDAGHNATQFFNGNWVSLPIDFPFKLFGTIGSACGTADFDGDGDVGTDADIEAFFACLAGDCCPTCHSGGADFDGDGDVGTDADIEAFFRVLAGGEC
jgi:hypothetical protein